VHQHQAKSLKFGEELSAVRPQVVPEGIWMAYGADAGKSHMGLERSLLRRESQGLKALLNPLVKYAKTFGGVLHPNVEHPGSLG
jgi:hypothetical protein